jgi:hypothetical protein
MSITKSSIGWKNRPRGWPTSLQLRSPVPLPQVGVAVAILTTPFGLDSCRSPAPKPKVSTAPAPWRHANMDDVFSYLALWETVMHGNTKGLLFPRSWETRPAERATSPTNPFLCCQRLRASLLPRAFAGSYLGHGCGGALAEVFAESETLDLTVRQAMNRSRPIGSNRPSAADRSFD